MIYGIYQIGFKPANKTPVKMLKTPDDFAASLVSYKGIKPLSNEITSALSQMERLKRKMETFKNVLSEQFSPTELSYQKFMTVATEVEKLFYQNVRSILNRLSTFDASEYDRLQSSGTSSFSPSVFEEKRKVYADYITFVKGSVSSNEEILLKVDKLLLEISKLDSFELAEIENMSAMKEMDALITQTKLYKQ
jgi:hypothetical protein